MRTRPRLNPSLATAAALLLLAASALLASACKSAGQPSTPGPAATTSPTSDGDNKTPTGEPSPDATGSTANGDIKKAEEVLRLTVLQPDQLPEGLQAVSDSFASNEDYIESSPDPETARENVERWGRILSHETNFQPTADAASDTSVRAITSTSSLYETAEGAALSFADARKTIDETDWQATHPELEQFREERITPDIPADELVWLRISGISTSLGGIIIEDYIIFRVGRQRGYMRVVTAAPGEDRTLQLDEVEGWLRAQVQAAKDTLDTGA